MIHSGLVSVTFRQHRPRHVVALVAHAGLESIEWGGDVHVPHGDLRQARLVKTMTENAGLKVSSYGSYYQAGVSDPGEFEAIVDTAHELGAPTIRIWAGNQGSSIADQGYRSRIADLSREAAVLAGQVGIRVAFEYHPNTLTDSGRSARELLEAVNHPNVESYWQPPPSSDLAHNLQEIDTIFPWLSNIHVFAWHKETHERLPLAAAETEWLSYLVRLAAGRRERYALIEFVRGDGDEAFLEDAATLTGWLAQVNSRNEHASG